MLDEIEYLTPAGVDVAEGPMPRISQFLAALRGVVQESSNFTFLLSGLTSAILESGRLYGRPNPLFSWAKSRYVGPLGKPDADRLATNLGARMGIAIDPGALDSLYQASGGHAYLYRNLASTVVATLPMDEMQRRITRATVLAHYDEWSVAVRGNVKEMLDHVDPITRSKASSSTSCARAPRRSPLSRRMSRRLRGVSGTSAYCIP